MENTINANAPVNTTSESAATASPEANRIPSINLSNINAKIKLVADEVASDQAIKANVQPAVVYSHEVSLERAMEDDTSLAKHDRPHYVQAFKVGMEKTARATLETCRVVFEASRVLDEYEFNKFCQDIGFKDLSSTIRKFIAIGKVYPRFIQHVDHLPHTWTNIYLLTQIPAEAFEQLLKRGKQLKEIKGKELSNLLLRTKDVSDLNHGLPYDKEAIGHAFGKVLFTRRIDDVDWRAMEKALNEIQARLPIKFVINSELLLMVEQRKNQRYSQSKKHFTGIEFTPEAWDYGDEGNAVQERLEPEEEAV